MTKRYAFWLQPNGNPHRKDRDKYAPTAVLAALGKKTTLSANGEISRPWWGIDKHEHVLLARAAILDPNGNALNDQDAANIFRQALDQEIIDRGGGKAISPSSLLARADLIASKHFLITPLDYVLVTSLSLKEFPKKRIRINGCQLSVVSDRAKSYPLSDRINRSNKRSLITHFESTEYLAMKISCVGRTENEATATALREIDFLRGIWTLFSTHGSETYPMGSSMAKSIGAIHVGPIHTLHSTAQEPDRGLYWFDPNYTVDQALFAPTIGWDKCEELRVKAFRQTRYLPYRSEFENIVAGYASALDEKNLDVACLKMWSLLETITSTANTTYDKTIERATWGLKDRGLWKGLLEGIRLSRNRYVHASEPNSEPRTAAYLVKSYVELHLFQLLRNEFKVHSIDEYGSFLDLPNDVNCLNNRMKSLDLARNLLRSNA